jgi:peroxiredoxin (alkyl hydroperoxide reductase subunit C)
MTLLIGKQAPSFNAQAAVEQTTINDFNLEALKGSNVVLFFYPLDFTFVCPTELHAFQEKLEEFEKRNTKVIGCSVDSVFSHLAWLRTPKNQGGIEGIKYPLVADMTKEIARSYGVLDENSGIAFRGLFLIDTKGVVRHQLINDLPLGRSVDEALRMVDALTFFEANGEVCPANWQQGEKAMKPNDKGLLTYFN